MEKNSVRMIFKTLVCNHATFFWCQDPFIFLKVTEDDKELLFPWLYLSTYKFFISMGYYYLLNALYKDPFSEEWYIEKKIVGYTFYPLGKIKLLKI